MIGLRVAGNVVVVGEPDEDVGVVTWLHCTIYEVTDTDEAGGEGEAEKEVDIGSASIAIIRAGEAASRDVSLIDALDADSGELVDLHDVYFDDEGLFREDFAEGFGSDLLYISEISVDETHRARNVDLAVIRQLCLSFGGGCELVVIPYESAAEMKRWSMLGFVVSTPGEETGLMHLQQAWVSPRIVESESGIFMVIPSISADELDKLN